MPRSHETKSRRGFLTETAKAGAGLVALSSLSPRSFAEARAAHIGNAAVRSGKKVTWDEKQQKLSFSG